MNTTEIRKKVNGYMEVGFTMSEAFKYIKESARGTSRKTNKVAEARAAAEERNGTTRYGWDGKSYGYGKWGKQ